MYRYTNDTSAVKAGLASNPNLPLEIMEILSDCGDDNVLQALIDNPHTPDDLRQQAISESGLRIHYLYYCEGVDDDIANSYISNVIYKAVQDNGAHYQGCNVDEADPDYPNELIIDVFVDYISDEIERENLEFKIAEALEAEFGWDASTHSNEVMVG